MRLSVQAALSELIDSVDISGATVQWIREGEFGLRIVPQEVTGRAQSASSEPSECGSPLPSKTVEAYVAVLLSELQRAAKTVGGLPERIYVSGVAQDLCRALHDAARVPVEEWNVTAAGADPVAFGLALRGLAADAGRLDLLPVERRVVRPERTVAVFSGLLALVCVLGLAWWGSEAMLERRGLARIEDDLLVVKRKAGDVAALRKEYVELTGRLRVLDGLASAQGRSMNLLKEVVLLLPPDVSLQEFTLDGNKLRLRGSTSASAAMLIAAFEHSALLENAAFTAPISVLGKDRQTFEIAATVRVRPSPDAAQVEGKGAL
jgi:Tfp pilus assembly protein PilN